MSVWWKYHGKRCGVYGTSGVLEEISFLENNKKINKLTGDNGIVYSYNTKFKVFATDIDNNLINTDGSTFESSKVENNNTSNGVSATFTIEKASIFSEILKDKEENILKETIGYIGGIIKSKDTKLIITEVNMDLSNVYDIVFTY